MRSSLDRGMKSSVDWLLVICYLLLVLSGLINIYASIHSDEVAFFDLSARSGKQAIWILSAIGLCILIMFVINPRLWEVIAIPSYLVVDVMLVLVIFLSSNVKGSHSWFDLGPVRFQPAEISKITTSLMLSLVLSKPNFRMSRAKDFIMAALVVGIPMIIIVAESETGSALVYAGFLFVLFLEGMSGWFLGWIGQCILLFILTLTAPKPVPFIVLVASTGIVYGLHRIKLSSFMARRRLRRICLGVLIAGVALIFSTGFVFENILQDHQRSRIEVLLGLKEDPMGVGYNVNQSKIAIGSGGLFGKGYLNGTQTAYGFVPEQSTDFIFCTVGEEWGFVGCAFVIILYAFLIFRIINRAGQSREACTRVYGYCVASCIFMHLVINVGMTVGLLPVIGIPLPLLSYGGSSLWAFTIMIFIFIVLDRQENKYF